MEGVLVNRLARLPRIGELWARLKTPASVKWSAREGNVGRVCEYPGAPYTAHTHSTHTCEKHKLVK